MDYTKINGSSSYLIKFVGIIAFVCVILIAVDVYEMKNSMPTIQIAKSDVHFVNQNLHNELTVQFQSSIESRASFLSFKIQNTQCKLNYKVLDVAGFAKSNEYFTGVSISDINLIAKLANQRNSSIDVSLTDTDYTILRKILRDVAFPISHSSDKRFFDIQYIF